MRRRTPLEVRNAAERLALSQAEQRERDGDPEGANVIRDLAATIGKLSLQTEARWAEDDG